MTKKRYKIFTSLREKTFDHTGEIVLLARNAKKKNFIAPGDGLQSFTFRNE